MEYAYLVVEGPHDVEVVGKVLKSNGFKRVQQLSKLDDYWLDIIPKNFPPEGDLLKRVSIPVFFQSNNFSVAVHSAGGITKIAKVLRLTLLNILKKENGFLSAVGVLIDADDEEAKISCQNIIQTLGDDDLAFSNIGSPGEIIENIPRIGIHVFPNNRDKGTLEDALIQCAEVVYPEILKGALNYVNNIDDQYRHNWGVTDEAKVIVGCIANILKPGKANQVSIQDNDWISSSTLDLRPVKEITDFLKNLLRY
ncbi:DUF3226 domain-containing protein [Paenibacillus maysiensis]|uniref:DUF3226 domain-containing protein n=1 Tax=Paenibacillus maysiensis TaxID=1155954 RepID=UPI0004722B5C|nr:DUF3226 domain-containing protein [Paenibacillus maysiensis]